MDNQNYNHNTNQTPLEQLERQTMHTDERVVKTYDIGQSSVKITERPIQYVFDGGLDSESVYYQKMLGVSYSRVMAQLQKGSLVYEAGAFTAALGDINFERIGLGAGTMIRGMLNKSRGEEFFKSRISGTGFVWLKETTSPLIAVELNKSRVVLEKGAFYAGFGNLKFSIAGDVGVSNVVLGGGRNLVNVSIEGSGVVILELPVKESELLKIPVRPGLPVQVDDALVLFRYGNVSRRTGLSGGVTTAFLNKEGVLDVYEGSGYVCVAPTLNIYHELGYTKPEIPEQN